jgi:hypothetical protein
VPRQFARLDARRAETDAAAKVMMAAIARLSRMRNAAETSGSPATLRAGQIMAAGHDALRRLVDEGATSMT